MCDDGPDSRLPAIREPSMDRLRADNFYSLPLVTLKPGGHLPFPLYIRSGPHRFCLYLPAGAPLSPSRWQHLSRARTRMVYVAQADRLRHIRYLNDFLESAINDATLPLDRKTAMVYGAVKEIVRQALEQPMPETIRACALAASSQVKIILADPGALLNILKISSYDYYTYTHSVNVGFLLMGMLHRLQPHLERSILAEFGLGGLLHDIGKTRLPRDLLHKPGKFTPDEFLLMQQHPELGLEVLRETYDLSSRGASVILQHHENLDGSGYPDGLTAPDLNLASRLVRIIDIYDALTTNRHYKPAMSPFQAFVLIKDEFALKVDQELVRELIQLVGEPTSSA